LQQKSPRPVYLANNKEALEILNVAETLYVGYLIPVFAKNQDPFRVFFMILL